MTVLGFTGTREGMTAAQADAVRGILRRASYVHHGGARGSDREAVGIALSLGIPADRLIEHKAKGIKSADYLRRDRDIALAVEELVATPARMVEELRSGTWATIRYARAAGRLLTIVWPDGSITYEP
jgi:predicted Rossmann fold nucleotide-binding protein DprA/Smf involved in DNA uptake